MGTTTIEWATRTSSPRAAGAKRGIWMRRWLGMNSKEWAEKALDLKHAREMGDLFVQLLVEAAVKGYQEGQTHMRERAIEECQRPKWVRHQGEPVQEVLLADEVEKRIANLPIE